MSKKVAIIGAGLGGLSAAIRLAHKGYQVDIYEQNNYVGGKAGNWEENGFRFDTGPSLLTMPFVLEELFKSIDKNINDYLNIKPLEVLTKYFYEDSTVINAFADANRFEAEIKKVLNISNPQLSKYLKHTKQIYDLTSEIFLFNSLSKSSTFLNWKSIKTLFQIWKIDALRSMNEANLKLLKEPKLVQIFNRYATYNGSNPYEAPATLNLISHVENNLGGFYVEGGIYQISKALKKLALEEDVKFHLNTKVEKIVVEKNKVKGIIVNSEEKLYDIAVSNADVSLTYKYLLNDERSKSAIKIAKQEPSSSLIVFMWGIKGTYDNLDIHNILFSNDYKKEFEEIFDKQIVPEDPTIYINISSKYCESDAPKNCENWFVLINTPYNSGQDWKDEVKKAKVKIIKKINRILKTNIEEKIICEKVINPIDLEKNTSSMHGSIYGSSSNSRFAAFFRQQNKSKEYKGLYFCGGSAHPGGGMPLVILSGKIASELIIEHLS